MNFIDNNGHVFSLPSYNSKPIGFEYEENDYIFWINDSKQNFLSINNYYIKIINVLIPIYNLNQSLDNIFNINISIDSNKFYLLNSIEINAVINSNKDIKDVININESSFKKKLSNDDLIIYNITENGNNYALLPLYVVCTSNEEGSWYTNILINIEHQYYIENKYLLSENGLNDNEFNYIYGDLLSTENSEVFKLENRNGDNYLVKNEWSFITVGGIFEDDNEPLYINGKNMGIDLPKDIIKSIYQCSYINDEFNFQLYNEKLKEYLINYMNIKGELGNYRSLENSLKWFGYGNHIIMSKLLQTDNQFKNQFIRDYFNINNDLLQSFQTFRNSTYVSLVLKLNEELNESYDFNFEQEFYGEGHPKLESLIDKYVIKHDEVNEHFNYIAPYYDYSFTELGLKLSCLKHYFKKYFMPIHLSIMSLSMTHKVYMNNIKHIFGDYTTITEQNEYITDTNDIEFSKNNELYFTKQIHYVDDILNEYKSISNNAKDNWYYINDTCVNIPIKFKEFDKPYNCTLLLERELNNLDNFGYFINVNYKFNINDTIKLYNINKESLNNEELYFSYSFDLKKYSIYYKGWSNLINIIKNNNKEEIILKSKYNNVITNELLYYFTFNNIDIYIENESKIIEYNDVYIYVPSISEININRMDVTDAVCNIYYINLFYIRIKYWDDDIYKIIINNYNINDNNNFNNVYLATQESNSNTIYVWENNDYNDEIFITEDEELIILEDNGLNKLIYDENLVKINFLPSSELLYETHFYVCQKENKKETIYNNFIIYPKIINKNEDISYWINNKFKIKLLVNNKWYFYDFTLKMPEPIIKLGKLEYNYWENENKYFTNFSQIKELTDDNVKFNSFMYNNELINVNHINFYTDYLKYALNNNLMYISGVEIKNEFYYSFKLNDQTIRINLQTYKNNFYINYLYLSELNKILYIYNDNIEYFVNENNTDLISTQNDNLLILEKSNIYVYTLDNITYILTQQNDNTIQCEDNQNNIITEDSEFVIDDQQYVDYKIYFEYNKSNDTYSMYKIVNDEKIILVENLQITINYNSGGTETFINKYYSKLNLSNNKKYLNHVILYDLYKEINKLTEDFILYNKSILNCKGIDFYFDNYNFNDSGNPITKIHVSGKVQQDIDDYQKLNEEFIKLYKDKKIDIVDSLTHKSLNINTSTDFNVYSINWNDLLVSIKYFYYEFVNINENNEIIGTGIFTDIPYSIIYNNRYDFYGYTYINCLNDINNIDNIDEYSDLYKNHKNNKKIKLIKENNTYIIIEENIVLNKTIIDKYNTQFNLEFYITETNELYIPSNIEYSSFYEEIKENKNNKYKIKVNFYINDGYKVNNIIHDYYGYTEESGNNTYGYMNKNNDFVLSSYYINESCKKINLIKKTELVYKDLSTGDKSLLPDNNAYIDSCKNIPYYYPGAHWYTISDNNNEYQFYDMVNLYFSDSKDMTKDMSNIEKVVDNFWIYNYFARHLDISKYAPYNEDGTENIIECNIQYKYEILVNGEIKDNVCIKPCVYIMHKDNTETIYNGNDLDLENYNFTLRSSDKIFYIFFQIINVKHNDEISGWIEPKFYFGKLSFEKLKYDPSLYNETDEIKIRIDNKDYYYGSNSSKEIVNLYKDFFNEEFVFYNYALLDNNELYASSYGLPKIYSQNVNLKDTYLKYDFYLMHDFEQWYVIYISTDTIDKTLTFNDLIISNKNKTLLHNINNKKYKLLYINDENKFLLNRMKYISSNGVNHFNNDDIIVAHLETNNRLPVNIFNSTKWNIESLSSSKNNIELSHSNSEMTILSLPTNDNEYYKGYYNINVRYCIDKYNQHQFKNIAKILIK